MASPTQITEKRRKMKKSNQGKVRKRKNRMQGTTPTKAELFGDE